MAITLDEIAEATKVSVTAVSKIISGKAPGMCRMNVVTNEGKFAEIGGGIKRRAL